ncbi:D-2-hydroxyacid dehydrogenase [Paenibacillus beijingensis]|uniref:Glycerate dehydrogenase n=1 Tax=Paenibacillus beijingensis TaxID=1126833 RepID=A0A0D5NFD3_9BACL|nr:D-2-hydroxyacid dehydrogenase [Paenibacillus beijingensis]AJY73667.1 glycerate dehydrogenase [Paenibacillus beijingensis]
MNIVVLDGFTLNPGDLSWKDLETLGKVSIFDRTREEQIIERAQEAQIVLTNKTPLTAKTLSKLPALKYIGVLATGYNIVDFKAAKELGITVTNVPGYSTGSVAQLVFALLLELCNQVQLHSDSVRQGEWTQCIDFCYTKSPLIELQGKTLGIIGFGQTGKQVAAIARAFGMNVIAATRSNKVSPGYEYIKLTGMSELFEQSDAISLHCPQTAETQGLINSGNLERMKRSAFLINTARGGLVVEQDLADALNNGHIAGAGVDVLSTEPPQSDNPLLTASNCIITPHIAWATKEARARLLNIAIQNIAGYLENKPVNVIQ